jgi:threonine dehydrogenase-like Zn-dependent dehydrogenase
VNFGAAFGNGIHMAMGQTHMQKYLHPLLEHIEKGHIDPTFLISHVVGIEQVPEMYAKWQKKEEHATKIVIDPWADTKPNGGRLQAA